LFGHFANVQSLIGELEDKIRAVNAKTYRLTRRGLTFPDMFISILSGKI